MLALFGKDSYLIGMCALCRHLAASEGCYKVTEWLIELGSDVNALDRFKRTPLEVMACFRPPLNTCWFSSPRRRQLASDIMHPKEMVKWANPLWTLLARSVPAWPSPSAADSWGLLHMSDYPKLMHGLFLCWIYCLQDAVRGEYVEETKLLLDRGGKIYENGKVRKGPNAFTPSFQCIWPTVLRSPHMLQCGCLMLSALIQPVDTLMVYAYCIKFSSSDANLFMLASCTVNTAGLSGGAADHRAALPSAIMPACVDAAGGPR